MIRLIVAVGVGIGLVSGAAAAKAQKAPVTTTAVMLSDLHFDPFRDPAKVARLARVPAEGWQAILSGPNSPDQAAKHDAMQVGCKGRGDDSDFALLSAALKAAKAQGAGARFVTVSGDLLVHQFECRYRASVAGDAALDTAEGYADFAEKTANYVMEQVESTFPKVPIYFALGNNDSNCGDYEMNASDRFLERTVAGVLRGLRGVSQEEAIRAAKDYKTGGYYSVTMGGGLEKTRLLVVEDIYMSRTYSTCAKAKETSEAAEEIAWMDKELRGAAERGERVWVMGHIPPVVDIYNTLRRLRNVCGGQAAEMFLGSSALGDVIAKHGDVVKLGVFGHTHSDEMLMLGDVPVKLVPSVSPINGNSPGFLVAQVNPATSVMEDYAVFARGEGGKWGREYGFRETYGVGEFTGKTVAGLIAGFQADKKAETPQSQAYERFFTAGTEGGAVLLSLAWPQYACALDRPTADGYRECVCKQ